MNIISQLCSVKDIFCWATHKPCQNPFSVVCCYAWHYTASEKESFLSRSSSPPGQIHLSVCFPSPACVCVINHASIEHLEVTMPLNRGSSIPTCCLYLDRRKTFRRSCCFAPWRVRSHFSFCTGKAGVFLGDKLNKLTTLLNSLWRNHCGGYWPTVIYNIEASTHLFMRSSL